MRIGIWVLTPRPITLAELQSITALVNASAARHDPPFGSLLMLDGTPATFVHITLQLRPAAAASGVVEAVVRAVAAWARQYELDLDLSLTDSGGDVVPLASGAGESELHEITEQLNRGLRSTVEAAMQQEPPDVTAPPTPEQVRKVIAKTTRLKMTGVVRRLDYEDGPFYKIKINHGWIFCTRSASGRGWEIWQKTSDETQPKRIWFTESLYVHHNLSLMLDLVLAIDPPGLEAEFSHVVNEIDSGVERKYFHTRLGPLIVHTRLVEMEGDRATETVIELTNPRRYLRCVSKRYAVVESPATTFLRVASLPF